MSDSKVAVLTSGGLDSAILVAYHARENRLVFPIYIQSGLVWETVELAHLRKYLCLLAKPFPRIQPLVLLQQPTTDLYGPHWSTTGQATPGANTPDEAVYLPGRNLLLSLKALLWCHLHNVPVLSLGVLGSNPFPDASDAFFQKWTAAIAQGISDHKLSIERPFSKLHKADVMKLGKDLPLEWSFSCIAPIDQLHCGKCNKCHERIQAFQDAGMRDRTKYK